MSELPTGWEWATIGDLLAPLEDGRIIHQGWSPKCETYPAADGSWGVLKTTAIQPGSFHPEHSKALPSTLEPRPGIEVQTGDHLLTCAGPRARCGVACLVKSTRSRLMMSGKMYRFRVNEAHVNARYLDAYLQSARAWLDIDAMKTGGSDSGLNLTQARFRELNVPLAPRAEQERIVAAIEEHFSRLEAAQASLRSAEARLGALESRSADEAFRSLGERVPVGELADVRGGIQKQPKRKPKDNPAPFLRVANVGHGWMNLDDVHQVELFDGEMERCRLEPGDLLVVEGNGSPDQIGRSAVWHGEIDPCVHQNHLIRVRPGPRLDPEFLGLYWNAPSTRAQLTAVASSTSGLHTLSTAKVKRVEVPVVPIDQQRSVVTQLAAQNVAFEHLRATLGVAGARQSTLRCAVLAAAFSGQLVAQVRDDVPASVLLDRIRAERAAAEPTKRTRKAKSS